MTEVEFTIREAIPTDAEEILQTLTLIGSETPYLVMDEKGMEMTPDEMSENLANLYESLNNVLMVALADGKVIGTASVKASSKNVWSILGRLESVF